MDWEGLGRTELHQTERIFSKEKMDKPTRPLAIMHRGAAGVCFVDARELAEELKMPPVYGSEEYYDSGEGVTESRHTGLSLCSRDAPKDRRAGLGRHQGSV